MKSFSEFLSVIIKVIVIAAVVFLVITLGMQFFENKKDADAAGKDIKTAYLVKTISRIYYTDDYEWRDDDLVLHGYWAKEKDNWVFYKTDFVLSKWFGFREVVER